MSIGTIKNKAISGLAEKLLWSIVVGIWVVILAAIRMYYTQQSIITKLDDRGVWMETQTEQGQETVKALQMLNYRMEQVESDIEKHIDNHD